MTVEADNVNHTGPAPMSLVGSTRERFNAIVVLMFNSLLLTGLATEHREKKVKVRPFKPAREFYRLEPVAE